MRTLFLALANVPLLYSNAAVIHCCETMYLHFQGQLRGRTEIAPDQREKFLQRLQQVQQGQSTMLGMPPLAGENHKQFSSQQHNSLLQQVILYLISYKLVLMSMYLIVAQL